MPESSFRSLGTVHFLSYSTLLGSQFYQSFIGGIVAYRALPRPQFSTLQSRIFPIYFSMSTALSVVLPLTYPGNNALGVASGPTGVLAEGNRWKVLVPLATMFVTNLVNTVYLGPQTTKVMKERKHQETRDGKKSYDPAPHSKEMQKLNKTFGRLHGASSLFNLMGFIATIWYGVSLSARIQ